MTGLSGVSEIVEVPHACAVFDKTYVAIYERGTNGLFRYQRSVRITETQQPRGRGWHTCDARKTSRSIRTDRPNAAHGAARRRKKRTDGD